MSNDPLRVQPEGRESSQHPENSSSAEEPGEGQNGAGKKAKSWEDLVKSPYPKRYSICRAENEEGKQFYVWMSEKGAYCSPVFDDYAKALEFPQMQPFVMLTPEEAVKLWEKGLE